MTKPIVLITDKYTYSAVAKLQESLPDYNVVVDLQVKEENLKQAQALLIRSKTVVSQKLLKKAPHLKTVITSTSGYDHIQLQECAQQDVTVMYTPDANIQSVAEMTLSFMIQLSRAFSLAEKTIAHKLWKDKLEKGKELNAAVLGIVGLGRIGKRVAQLAQCFQMKVVAHDPYIAESEFAKLDVTSMGLTELFRSCDFLSLHVPLTDKTHRLINAKTLDLLSSDAYLINTSRGKVVDEVDLANALKSQKLAGAALDVFQSEPLSTDSPLRECNGLILTPHIGAYTEQAFEKASLQAAEQLIEFIKTGNAKNTLV